MAELKYSDEHNFDDDFDDFEDESKMKPLTKFLLLIAGIIIIAGLFMIRDASNSSKVEVDYGTSSVYTKKDMDDAVKVIKRKFRRMKGFELHKVYFVEDETSESTLEIVNAKGKKQGWTETFTQVIYFQTDFQTPQKESEIMDTSLEADKEYIHYGWILARSDGGKWRIISGGY